MGDVITKVDDHDIKTMEDLTAVKKEYSAGDTATLTIYRGGETMTVELTWDAVPAEQQSQEETQSTQDSQNNSQNGNNYMDPYDMFEYFFGRR